MKGLFLTLACMVSLYSYGQLHNANWYFGDHAGFTFMTNPPSELTDMPLTNNFNPNEGCATLSDQNGNLLFYTDGVYVYTHNHTQMDNGDGLKGNISSSQNTVIIPRPGYAQQFYIFTINGELTATKGLFYSIVDMSLNSGYGKVVTKNVALKDHLGTTINETYNYGSNPPTEKITSTFCSDGINYWLVTQIKNYIYSYKVTENAVGISLVPNNYYSMPTEDITLNSQQFIKISPDGTRIATSFNYSTNSVSDPAFKTGSFNSTSGAISNVTNNISSVYVFDYPGEMEFSPDGNTLYYIIDATTSRLYKYNFLTNQTELVAQLLGAYDKFKGLRLALDGKIYIITIKGSYSLSVINSPNNYSSPGYVSEAIPLTRTPHSGIPQPVNWYPQNCASLNLYSEAHTNYLYQYKSDITTLGNYVTPVNSDIEMRASDFICFKPDTHITYGTDFYAHWGLCSPPETRIGQFQDNSESELQQISESNEIYLYPNPLASGSVLNITSNNGVEKAVAIYDVLGKQVLAGATVNGAINTTDLKAGIYIVKITEGTATATRKLIIK